MAHPAESRRKPRRDWNVSRSISFCSSLFSSILPEFLRKYTSYKTKTSDSTVLPFFPVCRRRDSHMVTEYFSKIVSTGKSGFCCNLFHTLSGIQEQRHRFANSRFLKILHGRNACFLPEASRKMGKGNPALFCQLFNPLHRCAVGIHLPYRFPNKKMCLLPLRTLYLPQKRTKKLIQKHTAFIRFRPVIRFSVFDASAVQSELLAICIRIKNISCFFQTVVLPHRTLHFHENENTEKSMVLRIPDADNICYSPESDTKILSRDAFHTFFRFFQTILFPKAYTASAIRNMFRGLYYEMHTVPSISFPPRRPAAKRSVRPVIQIQDSIYSDQIFHQKITSFIRFVFLFCTMSFIILFLIRKKQALL